MSDLIALVMSSTTIMAVLAAVYVVSDDPGRQARALELIRLILGR
ncbi:MAG TPA: hypothetical protein VI248_27340 [Kineosporiaceae bacterium]